MPDPSALQIVRDALRVRDQECVWVHSWNHTAELAQEIVKQAQLHGAAVALSLSTEGLTTHALKNAPLETVTTAPSHWFSGATTADALIILDGPADPGIFKNAEKGKALAITGTVHQLLGKAYANRVRTLFVRTTGITQKAAKTYDFDYDSWTQEVKQCLSSSQAAMIDLGQRLSIMLKKHREVHISSSGGTDLRFRTTGSPLIDDGIIDQADIESKNVLAQLPAGIVSIPINESSAEGTVVFTLSRAFLGDVVENLRLDFTKGQVVGLRAQKGEKTLERAFRAGTDSKDRLTRLVFGINPQAVTPFGQVTDALIPGTLTLGLGNNTFIGGHSKSNLCYEHTLNDAIVSIGPQAVIMEGKLTI
ncbi:MAG: aminopeptidase [Candidatus Hodarchaeota archaeon]